MPHGAHLSPLPKLAQDFNTLPRGDLADEEERRCQAGRVGRRRGEAEEWAALAVRPIEVHRRRRRTKGRRRFVIVLLPLCQGIQCSVSSRDKLGDEIDGKDLFFMLRYSWGKTWSKGSGVTSLQWSGDSSSSERTQFKLQLQDGHRALCQWFFHALLRDLRVFSNGFFKKQRLYKSIMHSTENK